jgi:non-heme chloroperoxidase
MRARTIMVGGSAGLTLVADEWGEPTAGGVPVLLLHGGAQTRQAWRGTAAALAGMGYYVQTLDLRGHGESDWAGDGDYSFEAVVADVRAVAGRLDRPVIVGASLGGVAALLGQAESGNHLARALVLVDVTPRIEVAGTERIIRFLTSRPDGFGSVEEAADAVAEYLPHRDRPGSTEGLARNLRRGTDGRYHWHWDPRVLAMITEARPAWTDSFREKLEEAASRLSIPVLLVRGGASDVVSPDGARQFLDLVPGAEYQEVPRAGHMVAGDQNDRFSEAVVGFLTRVAPSEDGHYKPICEER